MATAMLGTLLMVTALTLGVPPAPVAAAECELVPLHKVLAAPGGVLILRDGRELKAETHSVGGCETLSYDPTGARNMYDYTLMSHTSRRCVTGTGDDGRPPTYAGFQAITVTANGFRFATRFRMEDIDATRGFRKTMASLGVAGGRVVRPRLSLARGALVGVRDFVMPRASLAAVGFPAAEELLIDGVAYNASEPIGLPQRRDPDGKVKATVTYSEAVDKVAILYAVTMQTHDSTSSAALVSGLSFACGCPCAGSTDTTPVVLPAAGAPGRCVEKATTRTAHRCAYEGDLWCDEAEGTRWDWSAGGTAGACTNTTSRIHRPVSPFAPVAPFG